MKLQTTLLSLSLTFTLAAQAAPTTLLEYTSRNGSINPAFGARTNCLVLSDGNVFTRTTVGDIADGSTKKAKWKGIPNLTVLKSLIAEASNGMVVDRKGGPFPIGGRTETYTAYLGKKAIALKTQIGPVTMRTNTSPVTPRLVKFIAANCVSAGQ